MARRGAAGQETSRYDWSFSQVLSAHAEATTHELKSQNVLVVTQVGGE